MVDRLIEIGICYGLEISMVKTELKRFPRQTSSIQIILDQNQLQNVEYFNRFGGRITTDANCTREFISSIALKKQHSKRRRLLYHLTGLKFKKQTSEVLPLELSLHDAVTRTLRNLDRKYRSFFDMWCRRSWRRSAGQIM